MIPSLLLKQEKQVPRKKIILVLSLALLMISASVFIMGMLPSNNFAWIFLVITFVFGLLLATHATLTSNLYYHKPAKSCRKDNSIINGRILCAGVVFYIIALGIIQYLFLLLTGYNIDTGLDRSNRPPGAREEDIYWDFPLIQVIFSTIITVMLTKRLVHYLRNRNLD